MDPPGPWSAYASYNRLAAVTTAAGTELHHHLSNSGVGGAPPTTTAQLLTAAGSFLTPPTAVGYESVFSPLFHPAAKPTAAHYVQQQRALAQAAAATKPPSEGDYHQPGSFFDQSTWQQNSPFGILPHESVVPTSTANFNAHFAAAQNLSHINQQLAKNAASRAQSPQVTTPSKTNTSQANTTFYQVPTTFSATENSAANSSKTFTSSNTSNLQQTCIVSSPSVSRGVQQQPPANRQIPTVKQPAQPPPQTQIQTKAQTKIYPDLVSQTERLRNNEEIAPISFAIIDGSTRLVYQANNNAAAAKRTQFQHPTNYRHYPSSSGGSAEDFQRGPNSNGPDCNVVVPRRPSPLQAHSQASPIGHAQSPAYPMYNSPMNSSPQQSSSNNQVPSPLDVSVPRAPSQTSANVAYPSVIRNSNNCWDERQQPRKFAQQNNYNPEQRTAGLTERQQTYFDNEHQQVTLQDLSSCRGDPMSLVKNLQQQTCHIPEAKPEIKQPAKRRKSQDKDMLGRIPPPAHTTAAGGAVPQQQNGAYFDFDRWNLPPPSAKLFGAQAAIHQQHQGLMVPHPHGPHVPTIPYFASFHVAPPNNTGEFIPPSVELTTLTPYGEQQQMPQYAAAPAPDEPKVVVPNIEEELNFLYDGNIKPPVNPVPKTIHHPSPASGAAAPVIKTETKPANCGFMSSYLKFLQGDRDTSPPPIARGGRKQTWNKPKTETQYPHHLAVGQEIKIEPRNGMSEAPKPPIAPPTQRLTQGDPQDDPRYFPLPKERKRNNFDSSDDGFSSDDDFFSTKKNSGLNSMKDKNGKKGRPPMKPGAVGPSDKKRKQDIMHKRHERERKREKQRMEKLEDEIIPRRESSKRAAKEKTNNLKNTPKTAAGDDEPEEPPEFVDSDSDPAWTPKAKNEEEDDILPHKKVKKTSKKRIRGNLISAAAQGAGIDGFSEPYSGPKTTPSNKPGPPTLEDNIAASLPNRTSSVDENPYKPGEFVVIKADLKLDWPPIWRVDGKTLLQKYEPFEFSGATLYRNISTYTSWTPESKKQYMSIPVRYKSQGQLETIVEFLRNEMVVIDYKFQEQCMKESEIYQDNFEVYIQTLISQSLDSNFLTEIFQEQDDYFLSNVKTIDDNTHRKKTTLFALLGWPAKIQSAVCTWPCFNVITDINTEEAMRITCSACAKVGVALRVLMYGQPYNPTTLEGCQPDPNALSEKDFLMCRLCANRVELASKVTHQKYLMYIECSKRVTGKRSMDPNKDTTCILNELLADESWINQLFLDVRSSWSEVDCIEHYFKLKNNSVH